jgi:hypothetical protein
MTAGYREFNETRALIFCGCALSRLRFADRLYSCWLVADL